MFRKMILGIVETAVVAVMLIATPADAVAYHRRCCNGYAGGYSGDWNNLNKGYDGWNNTSFAGTAAKGTYHTNDAPQGYYAASGQWVNGAATTGTGEATRTGEIHPPKPSDPTPATPDPPTPNR